jgi:hypothetical protein
MNILATRVALGELDRALKVLEMPFGDLPKVLDNDGQDVTDPKEKRLRLVRTHIESAGNIINMVEQGEKIAELGVQTYLRVQHGKAVLEAVKELTGGAIPPGFELPPGVDDEEPENEPMGFAAVARRMAASRQPPG